MLIPQLSIGESDLFASEKDLIHSKQPDFIVHDYAYADWEGSGTSLIYTKQGLVEQFNHGHCSCFGPFEASMNSDEISEPTAIGTLQEYQEGRKSVGGDWDVAD